MSKKIETKMKWHDRDMYHRFHEGFYETVPADIPPGQPPEDAEDPVKRAKAWIQFFNETRKPHERERHLIKVVRVTTNVETLHIEPQPENTGGTS